MAIVFVFGKEQFRGAFAMNTVAIEITASIIRLVELNGRDAIGRPSRGCGLTERGALLMITP